MENDAKLPTELFYKELASTFTSLEAQRLVENDQRLLLLTQGVEAALKDAQRSAVCVPASSAAWAMLQALPSAVADIWMPTASRAKAGSALIELMSGRGGDSFPVPPLDMLEVRNACAAWQTTHAALDDDLSKAVGWQNGSEAATLAAQMADTAEEMLKKDASAREQTQGESLARLLSCVRVGGRPDGDSYRKYLTDDASWSNLVQAAESCFWSGEDVVEAMLKQLACLRKEVSLYEHVCQETGATVNAKIIDRSKSAEEQIETTLAEEFFIRTLDVAEPGMKKKLLMKQTEIADKFPYQLLHPVIRKRLEVVIAS